MNAMKRISHEGVLDGVMAEQWEGLMPLGCVMEGEPVGRYWIDVGAGEKEEPGIQAIMNDSLSPSSSLINSTL